LLGLLALGCASSSETDPPSDGANHQIGEACPGGRTLRITNTETGETTDIACEDVRAFVSTQALIGSEQIGEAQEKWSPLGLLCTVLVASAVGYGCERSQLDWRACTALGLGSLACDLI